MKRLLYFIVLLTAFPMAAYCQEPTAEDQNFHFIEAGIGTGLNKGMPAFNVGLSNSIGRSFGNFLDYSLYFDKSGIRRHDISIKIGPYLRIDKYSYLALSAGGSVMINTYDSNWKNKNGMLYYEEQYLLNIPIQAKVNTSLYKGFCIGVKAAYNKMIDKDNPDKSSVLLYLALGF